MDRRDALIDEICERLAILRAEAERQRMRRLLKRSVSLSHLYVLTVLRSEGPRPMGELADALGVSVASATGLLSRMEARGLIERSRDADDRRVVTVSLGRGGQAALDELEGRSRKHVEALLRRLTLAELDLVRGGFEALQRAGEQQPDGRTVGVLVASE